MMNGADPRPTRRKNGRTSLSNSKKKRRSGQQPQDDPQSPRKRRFKKFLKIAIILLILFAIIYPIVIALLQKRQIKKVWNSNKVAQNMNVRFDFYDTYFTEINDNGETRLEYDKLHKVIETKTNFYLMIAKNQGFILNKSNFPEGLEDFLRNIKIS